MLLKKPGKKTAWIIAGASFACILGCAGVVFMDWKKIGAENAQAVSIRQQIEKANMRIAKVPELEMRVLREREHVKELVKVLPDDQDINEFVNKISEFAKTSGVEIEALDDRSAKTRSQRKATETFVRIVYKMNLKATFSEFLDFINRFESYDRFVKVNQYSIRAETIQANSKDAADQGPQQHAIDLELETCVYNPAKRTSAPVEILNADQKLAKAMRGDVAKDMPPLLLDRYSYAGHPERRDPLADPRKTEGQKVEAKAPVTNEAEQKALQVLVEGLAKIQEAVTAEAGIDDLVKRIEFTKRTNTEIAAFREKIADLKKSEKPFASKELQDRFTAEIDVPFTKLLSERPDAVPDLLAHEIENQYKKLVVAFEARQYSDVTATAKTLLSSRPKDVDSTLAQLFEKVDVIGRRAEAHVEFEQKNIKFSGLVYKHSNPKQAVVIINERAYGIGDSMDDGTVVRAIDPNRVVFLYKREEITAILD